MCEHLLSTQLTPAHPNPQNFITAAGLAQRLLELPDMASARNKDLGDKAQKVLLLEQVALVDAVPLVGSDCSSSSDSSEESANGQE